MVAAKPAERKALVRERLLKLGTFAHFVQLLAAAEGRSANKELILEEIVMRLPNQRPAGTFDTLINWGRYAELFGYNRDEDRIYLDQV
jgi:NitT/TauT family transport system ATP-binding protein